jgi:hypothetical protein
VQLVSSKVCLSVSLRACPREAPAHSGLQHPRAPASDDTTYILGHLQSPSRTVRNVYEK